MPPRPSDTLLDAIYACGERLLDALDAGDFEATVACARERDALIARLPAEGEGTDAPRAARLTQQHRVLTERLQLAHDRLADALRRSDRFQHAAGSYAATHAQPRLQARG